MTEPVTMPRYVSVTYVNAVKIKSQEPTEASYSSPWKLTPEEIGQQPIIVSSFFMANNSPQNGGYYIDKGDGQPFYMSGQAFEAAYVKG